MRIIWDFPLPYAPIRIRDRSVDVMAVLRRISSRSRSAENVRGTYYWYDVKDDLRNGIEVEEESYTAPSGLEAQIMKIHDEHSTCLATISLNGVRTTVITSTPNGMKESRKIMIKVLNGFTP